MFTIFDHVILTLLYLTSTASRAAWNVSSVTAYAFHCFMWIVVSAIIALYMYI